MIRVVIFLMIVVIIALIGCLIAFWCTFKKFREVSLYNMDKFLKTTEKIIEVIEKSNKDIGNIFRKMQEKKN